MLKKALTLLTIWLIQASLSFGADINVLIIGSTDDAWDGQSVGGASALQVYNPTGIRNELENILSGAGLGTVNVVLEDRAAVSTNTNWNHKPNLASWFYYPYPADVEENVRWPNLRGESGTEWDYIILIPDPYTMEYLPGFYSFGVAEIWNEVNRSSNASPPEVVLLATWPRIGANSSVSHYNEVVYRTGRSGGIKVAPAGKAWAAAGSPRDGSYPSADGAYIAAASLFSRIWGQSASTSSYSYSANPGLADSTHSTVTANVGQPQYSGKFSFNNPLQMLGDKRRFLFHSHRGTSTESMMTGAAVEAFKTSGIWANSDMYTGTYSSNTPEDDGKGWKMSTDVPIAFNVGRDGYTRSESYKSWVVNPDYWQLGFAFQYQNPNDDEDDIRWKMSHDDMYTSKLIYDLGHMPTGRLLPIRTLIVKASKSDPNFVQTPDGEHLGASSLSAAGTFLTTMYSGRCPVDPEYNVQLLAKYTGYDTAWKMSQVQVRSPGFRVMPSHFRKQSIKGGTQETITVEFLMPPQNDVTVNLSVSNDDAVIVTPRTLVFTPGNHNIKQEIHIAAVKGGLADTSLRFDFNTVSNDEVFNELYETLDYTLIPSDDSPTTIVDLGSSSVSTPKNIPVNITPKVAQANLLNTSVTAPFYGELEWDGASFLYKPNLDFVGQDSIAYSVTINGVITKETITITVVDTLPQATRVAVSATDPIAAEEGSEPGAWTITRTGDLSGPLNVPFSLVGTATDAVDFNLSVPSHDVIIPANDASVTITLVPVDDAVFNEIYETAELIIGQSPDYTPIAGVASIQIIDNDLEDFNTLFSLDSPEDGFARIPSNMGIVMRATANPILAKQRPNGISISWSVVATPAGETATIETPNAESTAVTFSADGTFVLKATADDGTVQETRDVTVMVGETIQGGLWSGRVKGQTWELPNPKDKILTDIPYQTETRGDMISFASQIILTGRFYDADGNVSFTEDFIDHAYIKIDDTVVLDDVRPVVPPAGYVHQRTSTPNLQLTPGWHDIEIRVGQQANVSGGAQTTPGVGFDPDGGTNWQLFTDDASDGRQFRVDEGNIGPDVNAGVDISGVVADTPVSLLARYSDDGAPRGPNCAVLWAKISGPGNVVFDDPASLNPTVTFDAGGTYTLRVAVDDTGITTFDKIQITVLPNLTSAGSIGFTSANFSAPEGDGAGQLTITVTRRGGSTGPASVNFATSNGTATVGNNDFTSVSGSFYWNHAESDVKSFSIPIIGDTDFEGDETINLTLSDASGASLGTLATATATLVEDDRALYTVIYHGNGHEIGFPPPHAFKQTGIDLLVADNVNAMRKANHIFSGWNTAPDGSGTSYTAGSSYVIDADQDLYAQWSWVSNLFFEDFESPQVIGYQNEVLPDNDQWVGSNSGFGANNQGIVNKNGGDFADSNSVNTQGFAFRYTNTGLATSEGTIGKLALGLTYSVSFRVVMDNFTSGTAYEYDLIAIPAGTDRRDVHGLPSGARVLTGNSGNAPTDGSFSTVSFDFTADPVANLADLGDGICLRFKGSGNSAIIDDISVTVSQSNTTNYLTVSASDDSASEAGTDTAEWIITRTGTTATALTIPISMSGTAGAGDYSLSATGSVTIPAGQSSVTVTLTPQQDTDAEGTETAILVLGVDPAYKITVGTSTVTIADDDQPPVTYTLTYEAELGGSISGDLVQTLAGGVSGTTVTAVASTGYTFDQWSDGGTNVSRADSITADTTLTAFFTLNSYAVTYDGNGSNGGSVPSTGIKWHGVDLVVAASGTMVKAGEYFVGWNTAANGSGTAYNAGDTYSANTSRTLFAQWTSTAPSYTVEYVAADGGSISGQSFQTVQQGNTSSAVTAMAGPGYLFIQWNDGLTNASRSDSPMSDVTYTAYFAPISYTISYNGNGHEAGVLPHDQIKTHGVTLMLTDFLPTGLSRSGYTFTGWNTAADGSGTNYAPGGLYAGNSDLTLYARWSELVPNLFFEDFESPIVTGYAERTLPDNGTWVGATQGYNSNRHGLINKDGGAFVNPDPVNHQGYTFRYNNAGITTAAGVIGPVVGDDTITISFDAVMDGTTSATKYNLEVIAYDAGAPRNDVRSVPAGCTLLGSLVGDTASDGSISTHTLSVYIDPTIFAADLGKDLGIRFKPGTGAVIDNVRVTGTYVRVTYGITYDGNGHTGGSVPVDSAEYFASDTATLAGNIGNLVKAGYTFSGWNTAADGSGIAYSANDAFFISEDTTLYAQWTAGQQIADIALPAGISLMGYTGANPVDAQAAFQGLIDANQLSLVRWVNPADGQIKELYYTTFPSAGWINEIGNLTLGQGYVVKTSQACTLSISGNKDTSSVSHNLPAGYSIIGFNKETPVDAVTAFQSLVTAGKLELVRWVDPSNGSIKELYYTTFPSAGWVNEIGNLTEGQGYIIKLNAPHSGFQLP